jgi:phytoene synthase
MSDPASADPAPPPASVVPSTPKAADPLVAETVRHADRDRFLASLFAPSEHRPGLLALYAFSAEVARVREIVSDPLPGEMRCQWWRDALEPQVREPQARGDVRAHPVAASLLDTIERYKLPRAPFLSLIEARTFDLYDDLMPTVGDLEGYCGETSSALMRLASLVLADGRETGDPDLPGHAGVAYAMTGLLRAVPWHASHGQVYLPAELMTTFGVRREDVLAGQDSEGLRRLLRQMRDRARSHFNQARRLLPASPAYTAPAYLPLALVEPYLALMDRRDYHPFRTAVDLPEWRKIWILWRASRRAPG